MKTTAEKKRFIFDNNPGDIIIVKKMPDYNNDPFVKKKREQGLAQLKKAGLIPDHVK